MAKTAKKNKKTRRSSRRSSAAADRYVVPRRAKKARSARRSSAAADRYVVPRRSRKSNSDSGGSGYSFVRNWKRATSYKRISRDYSPLREILMAAAGAAVACQAPTALNLRGWGGFGIGYGGSWLAGVAFDSPGWQIGVAGAAFMHLYYRYTQQLTYDMWGRPIWDFDLTDPFPTTTAVDPTLKDDDSFLQFPGSQEYAVAYRPTDMPAAAGGGMNDYVGILPQRAGGGMNDYVGIQQGRPGGMNDYVGLPQGGMMQELPGRSGGMNDGMGTLAAAVHGLVVP